MKNLLIGLALLFSLMSIDAFALNPGTKHLDYGHGVSGEMIHIYKNGFSYMENLHNFTYDCGKIGLPSFLRIDSNEFTASEDGDSWVIRTDGSQFAMDPYIKSKYIIYIDRFEDIVKAKHQRERNR